MEPVTPIALAWSGGKDAHWALHLLLEQGHRPLLLCTLSAETQRVMMHGVPLPLIQAQADALGLPLHTVAIPTAPDHGTYAEHMGRAMADLKMRGLRQVAFGDLFLADLRAYREAQLAQVGLQAVFPLWGEDTHALPQQQWEAGVRTRIICIDRQLLPDTVLGRDLSPELIASLPPQVDPCGENGEFHTYVYQSPLYAQPIAIQNGPVHIGGYAGTEPDRWAWQELRIAL